MNVALSKAQQMYGSGRRKSKYNAMRTIVGEKAFHSRGEADRYLELKQLERAGLIHDLKTQVKFDLLAWTPNGPEKIGVYKADFTYRDMKTNEEIVEDFKGVRTAHYSRAARILKANYGIIIKETGK